MVSKLKITLCINIDSMFANPGKSINCSEVYSDRTNVAEDNLTLLTVLRFLRFMWTNIFL